MFNKFKSAPNNATTESEEAAEPVAPEEIVRKGRLQPGKMFLVDIEAGRIIEDDEIKDSLAESAPYGEWINAGMMKLSDLP
jgi:glutamate synthase (NADPH/NADH) large chain